MQGNGLVKEHQVRARGVPAHYRRKQTNKSQQLLRWMTEVKKEKTYDALEPDRASG
jgi:phosphoketolase